MTADEIAWLDAYHARVAETLMPLVASRYASRGSRPPQGRSVAEPTSTPEERDEARGHPYRLLALLIGCTAVGPLSLNILAPAMPGS